MFGLLSKQKSEGDPIWACPSYALMYHPTICRFPANCPTRPGTPKNQKSSVTDWPPKCLTAGHRIGRKVAPNSEIEVVLVPSRLLRLPFVPRGPLTGQGIREKLENQWQSRTWR